jgi:hypothetical protein
MCMKTTRMLTMVLSALTLTAGAAMASVNPPPSVPEPGSLMLLVTAFGAAAVGLRRRQ